MNTMSNIRLVTINGWHFHAVERNDVLYLLGRVGKVGDCIRP
jgi:hypothetical protein